MQHESIPAELVHEAFIQLDLCDPANPEALAEAWQGIRDILHRVGYSGYQLAALLNRDRFRRWQNRRSDLLASLSFGSAITYWFTGGYLHGISREHAFTLKGMLEHWMCGWHISVEQVTYACDILESYGIQITAPKHLYVGRSRDADDIAQVRRWCEEHFSDWHDSQLIRDILGRAKNRQYGESSSALYCDVREGLEDSYPVPITMELFLESLRGEGDAVIRMEICFLLETDPSHLWEHLSRHPRGTTRLQADDRRFATIRQRYWH